MAEQTMTVPQQYVEGFRRGVLREVAFQARCVSDPGESLEDVQASARLLKRDSTLLDQILAPNREGEDLEVHSDAETLAHALHTMADKVCAPELQEALNIGPLDSEGVRPVLEALTWAVDESERYFEIAHAEIVARKAEREGAAG